MPSVFVTLTDLAHEEFAQASLLNCISRGFQRAQQRVLVFSRVSIDLRDLGFGYFVSKFAAHTFTSRMDLEHDSGCRWSVQTEKLLQYVHHEFHWGVIVIEHQNFV